MDVGRQYSPVLAKAYADKSVDWAAHDLGRLYLRRAIAALPRESSVIDIGCGGGLDLSAYRDMGFANLLGLEPGPRDEALGRLGPGVPVLDGAFEVLPLESQSVDAALSRFAIHYCADLDRAFLEVARVLRPGGLFAFVTSHPAADALETPNPDGTITMTLFDGQIELTYPYHRIEAYMSPVFRGHFDVLDVHSYCGREADRGRNGKVNAICFLTRRKAVLT